LSTLSSRWGSTPEEKLIPYEEEKHGDIISINDFIDELASEERSEQLKRALERLPLELREVIILYELERLTYKELATALGGPNRDSDVHARPRTQTPPRRCRVRDVKPWIVTRPGGC
jgi:DNA-directed RNA polymerase specialized sigma24 family protein